MIPCKHCNTLNSLDSTFCKRCGTGLPEDELKVARAELEKIVDEGLVALNANKIEEAFAIAESTVASDPSSAKALSLKASCHERRGEIAEALECAEKIVELNPNSELDKIKRNQLRSALAASVRSQPPSGRWIAGLGAVSVGVLVLCCGIILARRPDASGDPVRVASNSHGGVAQDNGRTDFTAPDAVQGQNAPTVPAATGPAVNPSKPTNDTGNQVGPEQPRIDDSQNSGAGEGSRASGASGLRSLPAAGDTGDLEEIPLNPAPPPSTPKEASRPSGGDPEPSADTSSQAQTPAPVQTPPAPEPGQVDIRLHNENKRIGSSGSQSVTPSSGGSATVYAKIGANDLQMGSNSAAVTHLQQALQSGGDPVTLNHQLGIAYGRLGDNGNAAAAYQRAITACDSALQSGKRDPDMLRRVKEACQSALTLIKGG